jgi:hypothetical protein
MECTELLLSDTDDEDKGVAAANGVSQPAEVPHPLVAAEITPPCPPSPRPCPPSPRPCPPSPRRELKEQLMAEVAYADEHDTEDAVEVPKQRHRKKTPKATKKKKRPVRLHECPFITLPAVATIRLRSCHHSPPQLPPFASAVATIRLRCCHHSPPLLLCSLLPTFITLCYVIERCVLCSYVLKLCRWLRVGGVRSVPVSVCLPSQKAPRPLARSLVRC